MKRIESRLKAVEKRAAPTQKPGWLVGTLNPDGTVTAGGETISRAEWEQRLENATGVSYFIILDE